MIGSGTTSVQAHQQPQAFWQNPGQFQPLTTSSLPQTASLNLLEWLAAQTRTPQSKCEDTAKPLDVSALLAAVQSRTTQKPEFKPETNLADTPHQLSSSMRNISPGLNLAQGLLQVPVHAYHQASANQSVTHSIPQGIPGGAFVLSTVGQPLASPNMFLSNIPGTCSSNIHDSGIRQSGIISNAGVTILSPETLQNQVGQQFLTLIGQPLSNATFTTAPPQQVQKRRRKRRKASSCSSKYRGVSWHKRDKRWVARAWVHGRTENLGTYTSEKLAAIAVDERLIRSYGPTADMLLNFPNHDDRAKFAKEEEEKARAGYIEMNEEAEQAEQTSSSPTGNSSSSDETSTQVSSPGADDAKDLDDAAEPVGKKQRVF